ncbi:3'(2'),5'-bisphosphate nucleotidase CysQ [Methylocapsa sp. S129]|uniref:3'(2'),5'-bisphosphate nucleotidase CysQ n=1 Tax=Methylocapsa sp. S129 TaxID=1641869 RepID=UPI001FEF0492|nr:3'(2'),5'-bisphosphate nucleotidase CysQ [Methylocapsa sp. S129]
MSADAHRAVIDMNASTRDAIAVFFAEVALAAGPVVMNEYAKGCEVRTKRDSSPVTIADEKAEELILGLLRAGASTVPIIAEESMARGVQTAIGRSFILVDPLDGTREFIAGNGEFTINIALVRDEVPIAGAVYAPALTRLWFGGERAFVCEAAVGAPLPEKSFWRPIQTRPAPARALIALASRSHCDPATEAFLAKLPIGERRSAGSSLKFCALAEGAADVYPRFAPTMEWDTAAGDAVLRAAGGVVLAVEGGALLYGKKASGLRNGGFVAWGDSTLAATASMLNEAST